MTLKKSNKEFIADARTIHGRQYDYGITEYLKSSWPVNVLCREHGPFRILPTNHLRGQGCKVCGAAKQRATATKPFSEFVRQAREVHGSRYRYDISSYCNARTKMRILCPTHGAFSQPPEVHLRPTSCPKCATTERARKSRFSIQDFRKHLAKKHGNRLVYRGEKWLGLHVRIRATCSIHGQFNALPTALLYQRHGCPRCAYAQATPKRIAALRGRMKSGHEARKAAFLDAARERHGNRYDYSKVEFTTQRASIVIGCPIHGDIKQVAMTHLRAGCRACADADLKGRYSVAYFRRHPDERRILATLYYVRICSPGEQFFKVGITKTSIAARFGHLKGLGGAVTLLASRVATLWKAFRLEQDILRTHAARCPFRPKLREAKRGSVVGATECFSRPIRRYERYFGMR